LPPDGGIREGEVAALRLHQKLRIVQEPARGSFLRGEHQKAGAKTERVLRIRHAGPDGPQHPRRTAEALGHVIALGTARGGFGHQRQEAPFKQQPQLGQNRVQRQSLPRPAGGDRKRVAGRSPGGKQ
jgi:hypothetical protein